MCFYLPSSLGSPYPDIFFNLFFLLLIFLILFLICLYLHYNLYLFLVHNIRNGIFFIFSRSRIFSFNSCWFIFFFLSSNIRLYTFLTQPKFFEKKVICSKVGYILNLYAFLTIFIFSSLPLNIFFYNFYTCSTNTKKLLLQKYSFHNLDLIIEISFSADLIVSYF